MIHDGLHGSFHGIAPLVAPASFLSFLLLSLDHDFVRPWRLVYGSGCLAHRLIEMNISSSLSYLCLKLADDTRRFWRSPDSSSSMTHLIIRTCTTHPGLISHGSRSRYILDLISFGLPAPPTSVGRSSLIIFYSAPSTVLVLQARHHLYQLLPPHRPRVHHLLRPYPRPTRTLTQNPRLSSSITYLDHILIRARTHPLRVRGRAAVQVCILLLPSHPARRGKGRTNMISRPPRLGWASHMGI